MTIDRNWYAVYTKSRCEKKVADLLSIKGIENYCPLNKNQKQWSDRKKIILTPLFNSYVFVRINKNDQLTVKKTHGILNFVYWLGKPALIKDEEIITIKRFLNEYKNVQLEKIPVEINDGVKIVNGPLMEQEGHVISIKSKSVRILLPSLGYMMFVEVESSNVEIINSKINSISKIKQSNLAIK